MSEKRGYERALFAAFLEAAPDFSGEPLAKWSQPKDEREFPDIVGESVAGRRVGVEIAEWLNQDEIQEGKRKERIEEGFLAAIGDQGTNPTRHIKFVWLRPKQQIKTADADRFREELFRCIQECDERWPRERYWQNGHQLAADELGPYPLLARYLNAVKLFAAHGEQFERDWITFPLRVHVFDRETMFKPLREIVAGKIAHYGSRTGFDDLALLVVYNRAAIYNSPADTPLHSYDDAAAELKQMIGNERGPFDRAFLFIALEPGRVLRIW